MIHFRLQIRNLLRKYTPPAWKLRLRKIFYAPVEVFTARKPPDRLIPPKSLQFVGDGEFEKMGQQYMRHLINLTHLERNERILDAGCGVGRVAIPLTSYLSPQGAYWGFDIVKEGIDWCQAHITPRYQNFHFQCVNVYNGNYHPTGGLPATTFRFPYDSETFDVVFLASVFTHMLPAEVEHYLAEIARVLKPDGRCLMTYFLLNNESSALIQAGRSRVDLRDEVEGSLALYKKNPAMAIAHPEALIRSFYAACNLRIIPPIHYGAWCNREQSLTFQDIIVAAKEPAV